VALKDLVSDLSNFNGRSQYDKLDTQIKEGVDFIPNDDAPGFTPKTDLESLYIKANSPVLKKIDNPFVPASDGQFSQRWRKNIFPTQFKNGFFPIADAVSNYNPPENESLTFSINQHISTGPTQFTITSFDKTPKYENAHGNSLLPTPNLFDFKTFRERSRTSETPPFHSSVEAPFTNVSLPNIFSPTGYGVEFGLDGGTNLRDRYKDGSIHISSDDTKGTIGGPFPFTKFARLIPLTGRTSQFSNNEIPFTPSIYTQPDGFNMQQTTFALKRENFRRDGIGASIDTFNNTISDGLSIKTLESNYDDNIKDDLFEFSSGTYQNVPTGMGDNNVPSFGNFREIADPFNFDLFRQPFILRETGNQWGLDGTPATNPLGEFAGGFVRGAPGITGLIDRNITDKFRISKFLLTSKGLGFIGKQFVLQGLNPTLESKIWNPISVLGLVGLGRAASEISDIISSTLGTVPGGRAGSGNSITDVITGVGELAISAAIPIGHPERHLGGGRYENVVVTDVTPKGRLAQQAKAFSVKDVIPDLPPMDTKFKRFNDYVNNKVNKVMKGADAAQYVPKFALGNPNRYGFLISSAPKSIGKDGSVSFTGTADLAVTDITKAITKPGGTFNEKSQAPLKKQENQKYNTLTYKNLNDKNSYYNKIKGDDALFFDYSNSSTDSQFLKQRKEDDQRSQFIGNPATRADNIENKDIPSLRNVKTSGLSKVNLNNDAVDKVNMIPYGSNASNTKSFPATEFLVNSDFIKFRFRDVVHNKWIIFRALVEGISDSITPEYGEERYIGRPDKIYTYQGVDRNISFGFTIYPKTKQELPVLMEKLNYLVGMCYPSFTEGERMVTPFMELTMGDMFVDTPGLLSSLSITVEDATTWEIDDKLQFPHFIKAQCEFKHIGKYVPVSTGKHYDLDWLKMEAGGAGQSNDRFAKGKGFNFPDDRGYPLRDKKYNDVFNTQIPKSPETSTEAAAEQTA